MEGQDLIIDLGLVLMDGSWLHLRLNESTVLHCGMQIKMADVQTVVLDEVDVMFLDETFDLTAIGTSAPSGTQFVFVTATLPVAVADQVRT